jgi:anthranilate phosphoribosyltransferase
MTLETLTRQLSSGGELSETQSVDAVRDLVDPGIGPETKADFLAALAVKGETPGEIASFARALGGLSVAPPLDAETRAGVILDVCGTGGDRLSTFNISTTVALIAAAAGVAVAKHGNRAITSQSGSADVLEALGVPVNHAPEAAARSLRDHRFAFFFAPNFHPAFKHIAPARRLCAERRQRTIFNVLGPLLNPARPTAQLIGVPRPELCEPMARVAQTLGVRRGMVVCGQVPFAGEPVRHLDEFSTLGPTTVAEFYQEHGLNVSTVLPDASEVRPAALSDLAGGDRDANAVIILRLLRGEERGPKRDIVLLNAAAALFVAGKTRTMTDGWDLAARLIDDGQAMAKLEQIRRVA